MVTKNSPLLNSGEVKGSVRVMNAGQTILNGSVKVCGALILPGSPDIRVNGNTRLPPITNGTGSAQPAGYRVTLKGQVAIAGGIKQRVDPEPLPIAIAPVAGSGTRSVIIQSAHDPLGNPVTIRSLTYQWLIHGGDVAPRSLSQHQSQLQCRAHSHWRHFGCSRTI